jgi:hypothetical protein
MTVVLMVLQIFNLSYAQIATNDGASSLEEALNSAKGKIENLNETLSVNGGTGANMQTNLNESYTSPGLRIKIQHPLQWKIAVTNDLENCNIDNYCWFTVWGPIDYYVQPSIEFLSYSLDRPTYFFPAEELIKLYQSKGVYAANEVICYCRIGERSSHS